MGAAAEEEVPGSTADVGCCSAEAEAEGWHCSLCCSESADPNSVLVEEQDSRIHTIPV